MENLVYEEAASWLRVSVRTLKRLVKKRKIKPVRVCRRVIFPIKTLEKYIEDAAK